MQPNKKKKKKTAFEAEDLRYDCTSRKRPVQKKKITDAGWRENKVLGTNFEKKIKMESRTERNNVYVRRKDQDAPNHPWGKRGGG